MSQSTQGNSSPMIHRTRKKTLFSETDRYFRSLFNFLSTEYKRIGAKKNFDFVSLMLANQIPDDKAQGKDLAQPSGHFVDRFQSKYP